MKIEKYGQHILDKTNKFEVKKKKKSETKSSNNSKNFFKKIIIHIINKMSTIN